MELDFNSRKNYLYSREGALKMSESCLETIVLDGPDRKRILCSPVTGWIFLCRIDNRSLKIVSLIWTSENRI